MRQPTGSPLRTMRGGCGSGRSVTISSVITHGSLQQERRQRAAASCRPRYRRQCNNIVSPVSFNDYLFSPFSTLLSPLIIFSTNRRCLHSLLSLPPFFLLQFSFLFPRKLRRLAVNFISFDVNAMETPVLSE